MVDEGAVESMEFTLGSNASSDHREYEQCLGLTISLFHDLTLLHITTDDACEIHHDNPNATPTVD